MSFALRRACAGVSRPPTIACVKAIREKETPVVSVAGMEQQLRRPALGAELAHSRRQRRRERGSA